MDLNKKEMNDFLVETFNDILKIEEAALKSSTYNNITMKEFHLLETVYKHEVDNTENTAGIIATELRITPGSLTTAVSHLEKKGFLQRVPDEKDKRSVHILVTEKGKIANLEHQAFHDEMVEEILVKLSKDETMGFLKGLDALIAYFKRKDIKK